MVTPFVGVWIETRLGISLSLLPHVTPFVGVWIETFCLKIKVEMMSVTPFVGVWIETLVGGLFGKSNTSHTLRGCVD